MLIDEQDISKVTQQSLRQSIAVVHQDISLFHRSVLENFRYSRPDATDEDVLRAAEAARCTEFIARLPKGFDTIIGERGLKLSGGERQRLAIARAFLRNAPIILLDEATSALDTESEQSIQEALMRLVKAARSSPSRIGSRRSISFDRILVLERGRIVEDGPRPSCCGARVSIAACTCASSRRRGGHDGRPLIRPIALLGAGSGCSASPAPTPPPDRRRRQRPRPRPDPPAPSAAAPPASPPAAASPARRRASGAAAAAAAAPPPLRLRGKRPPRRGQPAPAGRGAASAAEEFETLQARDAASPCSARRCATPRARIWALVVDVLVDRSGLPLGAVIDFGGFLGVGSRKIAIDWQLLDLQSRRP